MEKQKRSRAAQESGAEGNCRQLIITLAVIYFRAYLILISINTRFMQGTRPWRYNPELNFYSAFPLSAYLPTLPIAFSESTTAYRHFI